MAIEYDWAGDARNGGEWFKKLRLSRNWSMRDVEKRSGGLIRPPSISEIENGKIAKPPMALLVKLGEVYGVTPNQVATAYGWWYPTESPESEPAELLTLKNVLSRLSPGMRYNTLKQIEAVALVAERESVRAGE